MLNSVKTKIKEVLLVEDDPIAQLVTKSMLEKFNCVVTIAENGKDALETISHNHYQLILLDLNLPDSSGIEISLAIQEKQQQLQQSENLPTIIALTAHTNAAMRQKCLNAGMQDMLSKPVSLVKVGQLLNSCVCAFETKPNVASNPVASKPVAASFSLRF